MRINRKRLEESREALGRIGETPRGGLTRLALSDEDRHGRDLLVGWMRGAGLQVSVDQMGNIFGLRPGTEALPPVFMGSHADSVPTGGKYDGQLGVLCALEAIRSLDDEGRRTRHPVGMIIFTNEEGARFQPAMVGSGVMAGKIPLEDAYNARDRDGKRLGEELERIGYIGPEPCIPRPMRAYLELHIEQGPILEEEQVPVGVVEGIVAISWSRLTLHGVQDHAGPTPMRMRHDALVAAAEVVSGVREIPRHIRGNMVATVGRLDVTPNIPNAIPGRVTMSIDLRDPDEHNLSRAVGMVDRLVKAEARREGVTYELEHYWRVPRTAVDAEGVNTGPTTPGAAPRAGGPAGRGRGRGARGSPTSSSTTGGCREPRSTRRW